MPGIVLLSRYGIIKHYNQEDMAGKIEANSTTLQQVSEVIHSSFQQDDHERNYNYWIDLLDRLQKVIHSPRALWCPLGRQPVGWCEPGPLCRQPGTPSPCCLGCCTSGSIGCPRHTSQCWCHSTPTVVPASGVDLRWSPVNDKKFNHKPWS